MLGLMNESEYWVRSKIIGYVFKQVPLFRKNGDKALLSALYCTGGSAKATYERAAPLLNDCHFLCFLIVLGYMVIRESTIIPP